MPGLSLERVELLKKLPNFEAKDITDAVLCILAIPPHVQVEVKNQPEKKVLVEDNLASHRSEDVIHLLLDNDINLSSSQLDAFSLAFGPVKKKMAFDFNRLPGVFQKGGTSKGRVSKASRGDEGFK
ncbi:hypothetical protein ILUMI_17823 [Ignelater luminosus]|uniref:Uncharacterized protein n=1 Tax=Ignelater luminosus TaxID=2038154 RepID=A0A8K0CQC0_IGNLU|nr:hypothetical protein ILUMI_17823 [Ignelater luminosus]